MKKDLDHEVHWHLFLLETLQEGGTGESVPSVLTDVEHAHTGDTPRHIHRILMSGRWDQKPPLS